MRYAYALIFTMLLTGVAVPDSLAQGRGRGQTSDSRTVERDDDDHNERSGRTRGRTGGVGSRDRDDDRYDTRSGRRNDSRRDRDDDWDDDDYDRTRKGNGPPFCRSGKGHPVHGWKWCEDKGYDNSDIRWPDDRRDRHDRWEDRTWKDIIFGDSRNRDSRRRGYDYDDYNRRMDRGILQDVLGNRVYRRFDDYRRAQRLNQEMVGYWLKPEKSRSRVMQLSAGDVPLAILTDYNGDGRVDAVRVNRLR